MSLKMPTSDEKRRLVLEEIMRVSRPSFGVAPVHLTDALLAEVQQTHEAFTSLLNRRAAEVENFEEVRQRVAEQLHVLRETLRAFNRSVLLAARKFPKPSDLKNYYRTYQPITVRINTFDLVNHALYLINALGEAESNGMVVPMAVPAEELREALGSLQEDAHFLSDYSSQRNSRSIADGAARNACNQVLRKVSATIRFACHGESQMELRQKYRAFGFNVASNSNGEPETDTADSNDDNLAEAATGSETQV